MLPAQANKPLENSGNVAPETALLLQQLAMETGHLNRPANLKAALRIGELVQRCLQPAGHLHESSKAVQSYRQLAESAKLGRSASVLWRCVKLYLLSETLPEIKNFTHLGTTHIRAIVNLPLDQQRILLVQAEAERWTSSRLEKAVGEFRHSSAGLERGRVSGFFPKPDADVARSLTAALTHVKRASKGARGTFSAPVRCDLEAKLAELQALLSELGSIVSGMQASPSSFPQSSETPGE